MTIPFPPLSAVASSYSASNLNCCKPAPAPSGNHLPITLIENGRYVIEHGSQLTYADTYVPESLPAASAYGESCHSLHDDVSRSDVVKFCIVTPSFNSKEYIDSTIMSVLAQEGEFEVHFHVQDGGSTDGTVEKLKSWSAVIADQQDLFVKCNKFTFTFDSTEDKGMYDAISKGFEIFDVADTDICAWINSDDFFVKGAFRSVHQIFSNVTESFWVVNPVSGVGKYGEELSFLPLQYPQEIIQRGLCDGQHWRFIQQEGIFWLGKLWHAVGGLNRDLKYSGDWDLWRRFAKFCSPIHLTWSLAKFRVHDKQLSGDIGAYFNEIGSVLPYRERDRLAREVEGISVSTIPTIERSKGFDRYEVIRYHLKRDQFLHPPSTSDVSPISFDRLINQEPSTSSHKPKAEAAKIATLCTLSSGGAGTGSVRRITALRKAQANVRLLSLVTSGYQDEFVDRIVPPLDCVDTKDDKKIWRLVYDNCVSPVLHDPAFKGHEFFSLPKSVLEFPPIANFLQSFDILHFHWVVGMLDYEHLPAVLHSVPIVWTLGDMNAFTGGCHYSHGCDGFTRQCRDCPQWPTSNDQAHLNWLLKKEAYASLNMHFVCPSSWIADLAGKSSLIGDFPIHVIPNAYPVDSLQTIDKGEARKFLGLPPDKKLVLFGSDNLHNVRKGGDLLLEAITYLETMLPKKSFEIVLFGNGKLDTSIKVHNLGRVDQSKLRYVYSAADVFVSPSREDVGPMTVGESLLCGTPVVGFPIGILPDVGKHKQTTYLAEPFKHESLAKGIEWFLGDAGARDSLPQECRELAIQFCDPAISAKKHIALYDSTLRATVGAGTAPGNSLDNHCITPGGSSSVETPNTALPTHAPNRSRRDAFYAYFSQGRYGILTYSLKEHAAHILPGTGHGGSGRPNVVTLAHYQRMLVDYFIRASLPLGSRILQIGDVGKELLEAHSERHEFWAMKACGESNVVKNSKNGPHGLLVPATIGSFSSYLPDNYFDCIYYLQESPLQVDVSVYPEITKDIRRLLSSNGIGLFSSFAMITQNRVDLSSFMLHVFSQETTLNSFDPALPHMSSLLHESTDGALKVCINAIMRK